RKRLVPVVCHCSAALTTNPMPMAAVTAMNSLARTFMALPAILLARRLPPVTLLRLLMDPFVFQLFTSLPAVIANPALDPFRHSVSSWELTDETIWRNLPIPGPDGQLPKYH